MDFKELEKFVQWQHLIRTEAHNNKELGFDKDLKDFINLMRCLPPQNYGTRIQNRIIQKLKFKKLKASDNKGDCLDNFGDHYEIKVSIIDGINIFLNVVNVRSWQKVHYYVVAFDCRSDFKCYFFRLSKNEMEYELKKIRTSNCSGTIKSNEENENVVKRFSIEIDSKDWFRWCDKYLSNAGNII